MDGVCIGFVEGKEMIRSKELMEVIDFLLDNYHDKEIRIASYQDSKRCFIV